MTDKQAGKLARRWNTVLNKHHKVTARTILDRLTLDDLDQLRRGRSFSWQVPQDHLLPRFKRGKLDWESKAVYLAIRPYEIDVQHTDATAMFEERDDASE